MDDKLLTVVLYSPLIFLAWIAIIFGAPFMPSSMSLLETGEQDSIRSSLDLDSAGLHDGRVEFKGAGNLRLYVSRSQYEAIPYPDRGEALAPIVDGYSSKLNGLAYVLFPTVYVYDIRSGEKLDSFSCFASKFRQSTQAHHATLTPQRRGNLDKLLRERLLSR